MACKRKRPEEDAAQEWGLEAGDAFLFGIVSGKRIQRMALKAQRAGAAGDESIARAAASGLHPQNAHRDVTRALRRKTLWPKYYYAKKPVWDETNECMVEKEHAFLLPHE